MTPSDPFPPKMLGGIQTLEYTDPELEAMRRRYQNRRFFESLGRWAIIAFVLGIYAGVLYVGLHFAIKYW
jgi:hypothetical protein